MTSVVAVLMRRIGVVGCVIFGGCAIVATSSAVAATPRPVWEIRVVSYPTNFAAKSVNSTESGPGYQILATNIGGARTAGTFTVTDTLPAGVTVAPGKSPHGVFGKRHLQGENLLTCSTAGQTVTCTGSSPE